MKFQSTIIRILSLLIMLQVTMSFQQRQRQRQQQHNSIGLRINNNYNNYNEEMKFSRSSSSLLLLNMFGGLASGGGGGGSSKIPTSDADREKQAITSIKAAIEKPKNSNFRLIECEFPPLQELNKLGDGSLRSANQVDDANLNFCSKLIRGIKPLPFVGPKTWLLTSGSSSSNFNSKASKLIKTADHIHSLKDGIPDNVQSNDILILVSPSSMQDYKIAEQIARNGIGKAIIIVNGLAKNPKSIAGAATMAYFLKPLTYNSQVVGYLVRSYPNNWCTIDLLSKQVLGSFSDNEILVRNTNTPDLRESGRLVQKSVDLRAIRSRKN